MKYLLTLFLALGIVGCKEYGGDSAVDPGFSQFGETGTASTIKLSASSNTVSVSSGGSVQLTGVAEDLKGRLIKDDICRFRKDGITLPGGLIETGEDGKCSLNYTPSTAGVHVVEVQVFNESQGAWISKTLTINVSKEYSLQLVSGDNQTKTVSQDLDEKFVVKVVNENGDAISGRQVVFSSPTLGNLDSLIVNSDVNGLAEVQYTGGAVAGDETIMASIDNSDLTGGNHSVEFDVSLEDFRGLACSSGTNQTLARGVNSANITCRVVDSEGNGIIGVDITASVGSGSFIANPISTDVNGYANFVYQTPALAGVQVINFNIVPGGSGGVSNDTASMNVVDYTPTTANLTTSDVLLRLREVSNLISEGTTPASVDTGNVKTASNNFIDGATIGTLTDVDDSEAVGDNDESYTTLTDGDTITIDVNGTLPSGTGSCDEVAGSSSMFSTLSCVVNGAYNFLRSEIIAGILGIEITADDGGPLDTLTSNSLTLVEYTLTKRSNSANFLNSWVATGGDQALIYSTFGGVRGLYIYDMSDNSLDLVYAGNGFTSGVYHPTVGKFYFLADNVADSWDRAYSYDYGTHTIYQEGNGRYAVEGIAYYPADDSLYFTDYGTRRNLFRLTPTAIPEAYEVAFRDTTGHDSFGLSAWAVSDGCLFFNKRISGSEKTLRYCNDGKYNQIYSGNPARMWAYNNSVVINSNEPGNYKLLWIEDKGGDDFEAHQISDINPGGGDLVYQAVEYNSNFYFVESGELYVYDGTSTNKVKQFNSGGSSSVSGLAVWDGKLWFSANIGGGDYHLFVLEGSSLTSFDWGADLRLTGATPMGNGDCLLLWGEQLAVDDSLWTLCK